MKCGVHNCNEEATTNISSISLEGIQPFEFCEKHMKELKKLYEKNASREEVERWLYQN